MRKIKLKYGNTTKAQFELDFIKNLHPLLDDVIVLVPEQFSSDTEKYLIEKLGNKGLFNISVYGFTKLIGELSLDFGLADNHLTDFGKSLILSKILKERRFELKIYKNTSSGGFVKGLLALLDSFRSEGVDAQYLKSVSEALSGTQPYLSNKTAELSIILGDFQEALKTADIDSIELLHRLTEKLALSKPKKNLYLIVEGFNGMNKLEMDFLASLSSYASGGTLISILKSEEGVLKSYSDKFFSSLKRALFEAGLEFQIEEELAPDNSINQRSSLFSNIFSFDRKHFDVEGLRVVECNTREDELSFVALDILKKIRTEGGTWADFAIISNSIDKYGKHIYKCLSDFKIPYYVDDKISARDLSFCAFLIASLHAIKQSFSSRYILEMLKYSAYAELPSLKLGAEEYYEKYKKNSDLYFNIYSKLQIYAYENKISHGMWHEDKYFSAFFSALASSEIREESRVKAEIKAAFSSKMFLLKELADGLKSALSYADMLKSLQLYIEKTELTDKLATLKDLYLRLGMEDEYRRIQAQDLALNGVLGQLEMVEDVPFDNSFEFIDFVISAFDDFELSLKPPEHETIVLGTAGRSRLLGIKYLYLIGANEGLMPSESKSNVFFSENEIMQLENQNLSGLKRNKNFMDKEVFDIYEKMVFAEREVIFSYSTHGDENEEIDKCYWLKSIMSQSGIKVAEIIDGIGVSELREAGILGKYLDYKMINAAGSALPEASEIEFASRKSEADFESNIELFKSADSDGTAFLSPSNVDKFKEGLKTISVSRLETHAECPFKYFVSDVLRPEEMPKDEVDARTYGNIFHQTFENFVLKYLRSEDKQNFAEAAGSHIMEELILSAQAHPPYKYDSDEIKKLTYLKPYLEAVADVLIGHFSSDNLYDVECEYKFEEDRGDLKLIGKVDRVDVFDVGGNKYFRVVDYKSSDKDFSMNDFIAGIQLQLPLYLNHFVKAKSPFGCGQPYSFGYFDFHEQFLKNETVEQGWDEDKIRALYLMKGKVLKDVDVAAHVEKDLLTKGVSSVIKGLKMTKSNTIDGRSSAPVTEGGFEDMFSKVEEMMTLLSSSLKRGKIDIHPYKNSKMTACNYCNFRNICKFDSGRHRSKYRTEALVDNPDLKR